MLQSGEPANSSPLAFAEGLFNFCKYFSKKRRVYQEFVVL